MTKLSDIGELGIIDIIRKTTYNSDLSVDKLTDDVAILDVGNRYLLLKTDASFEEYDFPPFATPEEVAQTSLAIAVSDFAAKGVKPLAIMTSLELPKDMEIEYFERLSKGLDYHARRYGAEIVGGDISESNRLAITPFVAGFSEKDKIMFRRGATEGDVLAIADYIGNYVAGYLALKNKVELTEESREYLRKKVLNIEPQLDVGVGIVETRKISSTIDLNDGLEKCSKEIAQLNNVDICLYRNEIPISVHAREVANKIDIEPENLAFSFGGDLNIMMTFQPEYFDIVKRTVNNTGKELFRIGEIRNGSGNVFIGENSSGVILNERELEKSSYEHFVTGPLYGDEFWKEVSF